MAAALFPVSFVLASSSGHWVVLVACLLFLLFAEILNSALEALADKVCLQQDELIGRTKDLGSSAVFIAICIVGLIWGEALYSTLFN